MSFRETAPPVAVPALLLAARSAVVAAYSDLLAMPDEGLERPWTWGNGTADVRYGFYRLFEVIEEAAVDVEQSLGPRRAVAGRVIGQAAGALWDVHGLLLPLRDADLDRDPGSGEWPLRRTLAHLVSVVRSYALKTAYGVHRARSAAPDTLPVNPPDSALPTAPAFEDEARGSVADIRQRLQEAFDAGLCSLGNIDDELSLNAPSAWAGHPVTVRFRLHRWSSHLREHTLQMDKTLVLLGRHPREVERLARLGLAAYGRLEGACYGVPETTLLGNAEVPLARLRSTFERTAAELRALA